MKIVADIDIPFLKGAIEPFIDVEYYKGSSIDKEKIKDADGLIIRTRTICNKVLLEGTKVKFIATATIGYDHIDTEYCEKKGITWANAPGCNSGSVMQYIAASILYFARENNIDLKTRVLGVVGVGNVGRKVVNLAETLEMQVLLNDPPRQREEGPCQFISIDGILRDADILTFHVPLNMDGTDRTYHMVDINLLSKLNNGSLLINTSRGEIIDSDALLKGQKVNKPEFTVLDVWEKEPYPRRDILNKSFLATPHIAGYSSDGKALGTQMAIRSVSKFFNLGIDDWEIPMLPEPESSTIKYNCHKKNFQEVATDLVLVTYPIFNDDNNFRKAPRRFEHLRSEYWTRREFGAYKVLLRNADERIINKVRELGFNVISER
ncbi:MAG: 4-phosphoerythronate dehydrogenase [Bacteroidales bacterium]|nr:4-phosphoerythronate dehydrogenase [Bacteroidales bacterium]